VERQWLSGQKNADSIRETVEKSAPTEEGSGMLEQRQRVPGDPAYEISPGTN